MSIYKTSVWIKLVLAAVVVMVMCGLTGCSTSVTALSADENQEVAQYMADKLLRYDSDYSQKELIYTDPTQVTDPPAASAAPVVESASESTNEPTVIPSVTDNETSGENVESEETQVLDWNEFFTNDKWSVTYSSYDTYHTYPKASDIYAIDASKGKQLLVLRFQVANKTDSNIEVDFTHENLSYVLYVGGEKYTPMVAILENGGLLYLDIKLSPGESETAELVFEIPDGTDLSDMHLEVSR